MSVIVGIRADAYPGPDADDAALLLDVLGLLPDPTNPEVNDDRP